MPRRDRFVVDIRDALGDTYPMERLTFKEAQEELLYSPGARHFGAKIYELKPVKIKTRKSR